MQKETTLFNNVLKIEDILQAAETIKPYLAPTPFHHYPLLSRELGMESWVKLENTQPIGSFKVRGGIHFFSSLDQESRARGVVSATRGNHGQSLAFAARMYASPCTVIVPEGNNPDKNKAMQAFGAEVIQAGKDFDEACLIAENYAQENGRFLVHPAHPKLIAGVGTIGKELSEQSRHALDAVFVPAGVGSCLTGIALAMKHLSPGTKVIGVQAERIPSLYESFQRRTSYTAPSSTTLADGIACRVPAAHILDLMWSYVDDMISVSEEEIRLSLKIYLETTHQLPEGAAAAALAGARKFREKFAGKRVGLIFTGGNIDGATLASILQNKE